MKVSPVAGKPTELSMPVNRTGLLRARTTVSHDRSLLGKRVGFDTSEYRESTFGKAFNEWRILAISQALCPTRAQQNTAGLLFPGVDTRALSVPDLLNKFAAPAASGERRI